MENDPVEDAIFRAHFKIITMLQETRDNYLKDYVDNPANYQGLTEEDAFIWFCESLN